MIGLHCLGGPDFSSRSINFHGQGIILPQKVFFTATEVLRDIMVNKPAEPLVKTYTQKKN